MRLSRVLVPILALTLAGLPSAAALGETSEVTFYGHVFGHGRGAPMPMNTQFPRGEADYSIGTVGHTCGTPGGTDCEADPTNEVWLYTTAGFVQIKGREGFDYAQLHNERGLTRDTYLDTSRDVLATFYMSADAHAFPLIACEPGAPRDVPWPIPCWNWDPGYLAQWQVEATIYTGILGEHGGAATEAPDVATAFGEGKLVPLASGVSDPVDVQSLEATGQPTVWRFDVNLGPPQREMIPKEESYVVRYQWWGLKPDGSKAVYPELDVWNVNAGEFYAPTITLPVKDAFTVELVIPQFVYDKLVILAIMNTPWGSYDVDQDSIELKVTDSSGRPVDPVRLTRLADFSVAHEGHYKPVNVTYVWDYRADALPPGEYKVKVTASNFQGSAAASCDAAFTIRSDRNGGPIRIGECGARTISDDQLARVEEGSAQDAQSAGGAPLDVALRLQGASVAPAGPAFAPLAALAALAVALLARRWRA